MVENDEKESGGFGIDLKAAAEALKSEAQKAAEDLREKITPPVDVLKIQEKSYPYDYSFIAPVAMLQGFPVHDPLDIKWTAQVLSITAKILQNAAAVRKAWGRETPHELGLLPSGGFLQTAFAGGTKPSLDEIVESLRPPSMTEKVSHPEIWFKEVLDALKDVLPDIDGPSQEGANSLAAYDKLFQTIPLPAIAGTFQQDTTFAEMRVAGPNPTSLFRAKALPSGFPLTEAQYSAVIPGDSLAQALADGRLYLVDYTGQEPAVNGSYPSWQKFGFEPRALFAVPPQGGELVPVAVQCGADPAKHAVYTPGDGDSWLLAKTVVQVADGNFHELVAHLGRTHLLIEPFAVVTKRALSDKHALRTLLEPHMEGTLFINWAAGEFLVASKNFVDMLLSGTIDADRTAAIRGASGKTFNESFLPKWLAAQGLDDVKKLPHYPFRDDALLLWDAIGAWTSDYVSVCWPDDAAVQQDAELQAWAKELASHDGGRVVGFGDVKAGGIATTTYLAAALQMVIFTASAMHAAVNFPQADLMTYAPALPLAGYTSGPSGDVPKEAFYQFLTPLKQAMTQLSFLYFLGGVHHTQLGQYKENQFDNPEIKKALQVFQDRLAEIEKTINTRNETRQRYEYLLPSKIPQSINI